MKLIVTGHDAEGNPRVIAEGEPSHVVRMDRLAGLTFTELWATEADQGEATPEQAWEMDRTAFAPAPGGTRFRTVTFPPDAELAQVLAEPDARQAALAQFFASVPGLAKSHDPADPAMHQTDTFDYAIILDGEIWLDLGNGEPVRMRAGDVAVQQGTRHAWRNRSARPCTIAFILVGRPAGT